MMGRSGKIKFFVIFVLFLGVLISYQNCAPYNSRRASSDIFGNDLPPDPNPNEDPKESSPGILQRTQVGNLNFPLEAPPIGNYLMQNAFTNLNFNLPIFLTALPDNSNRLLVVERAGRIIVFDNNDNTQASNVYLDISGRIITNGEHGMLGLAVDPEFATNGYIYVYYSTSSNQGASESRISRFQATPGANQINANTEKLIINAIQPAANHNGGMIAFGPDGYLYIAFGDGGGSNDQFNQSQDRTTLLGNIVRIDPNGGDPYAIPPDNPFVGNNNNWRQEIFAYGVRNPWRFSFDRDTGDLWVADVGQDAFEEISIVENGDNLGWPNYEGNNQHLNGNNLPFNQTKGPVFTYAHNNGNASITGGYVYRGNSALSLSGRYIYGDYESGAIWALSNNNGQYQNTQIADSETLVSFGEDNNGEIYAISFSRGIQRIVEDGNSNGQPMPQFLSQTGLFSNVVNMTPAPGVVEYEVAHPLWSDGARKTRWIALPGNSQIQYSANSDWVFPLGTVLVKHFEIPSSATTLRRLETRVLILQNQGWRGYVYKWNALQTDAELLTGGLSENISVFDPSFGLVQRQWNYPSRSQCLSCHTEAAGRVLGVTSQQINVRKFYPSGYSNQLFTWNHINLFTRDIIQDTWPEPFKSIDDPQASVEEKARAYMHVHCSVCHQPGGKANVDIDFRYQTPIQDMDLLNIQATENLGVPGLLRLSPGNPNNSAVYRRIDNRNPTSMPPLGSNVVDFEAANVINQWIQSL